MPRVALRMLRQAGRDAMPQMLSMISEVVGIGPIKLSERQTGAFARQLQQRFGRMRGHLLGIDLMAGRISPELARYAFFEGLLYECQGDARSERGDGDACLALLHRLEDQAAPTARHLLLPGYLDARRAVDALALDLARSPHNTALDAANAAWAQTDDARKLLHFFQLLPAQARRWRDEEPSRVTPTMVAQLTDEYRGCAAAFEQHIRRLGGLAEVGGTGGQPRWKFWLKTRLVEILAEVRKAGPQSPLNSLAAGVDRNVRNVLAHGHPIVNRVAKVVEFRSDGRTVASWSPKEFFTNTRRLTSFVVAMFAFDDQFQLVRLRDVVHALASSAIDAGAPVRKPRSRGPAHGAK